jgi:5'-nucleotidase
MRVQTMPTSRRGTTTPLPMPSSDSAALKRSIVLSNDDGVEAPGLAALAEVLSSKADCLIVAPSGPQSGVGHAVTTNRPMVLQELGSQRFGLDGTPADCVRVALGERGAFARKQLGDTAKAPPLWLIAGINHGANLGMDVYISGTAAAAREAAILGFPAIAISQYVAKHRQPDWQATAERAAQALEVLLVRPPRAGSFWNVNLPHPADESTGHDIVFCPVDPSPHAFRYETRDGELHWISDFHNRPRRQGHDIDTCMSSGQIAISELPIQPFLENFL